MFEFRNSILGSLKIFAKSLLPTMINYENMKPITSVRKIKETSYILKIL